MRFIPSTVGPQVAGRKPVSARETISHQEAVDAFVAACLTEAEAKGIDVSELPFGRGVVHEPTAAERIAEHTGDDVFALSDKIADALHAAGYQRLTSAERLVIANTVRDHRKS